MSKLTTEERATMRGQYIRIIDAPISREDIGLTMNSLRALDDLDAAEKREYQANVSAFNEAKENKDLRAQLVAKGFESVERSYKEASKVAIDILWAEHPEIPYESPAQVLMWLKAERDDLRAQLGKRDARIAMFQNAVPQTWGEICQKLGTMPPCEPHEWDNRTTAENAVWALVTVVGQQATIETLEKEVSEERKLKRETLDKFANYCIERNEHVKLMTTLREDWDIERTRREELAAVCLYKDAAIAKMREALELAQSDIIRHSADYHHETSMSTHRVIRVALSSDTGKTQESSYSPPSTGTGVSPRNEESINPGLANGWEDRYKVQSDKIAELKVALAEAKLDTERLDYIEKAKAFPAKHSDWHGLWEMSPWQDSRRFNTFRAAIDAARGKEKP